MTDEELRAKIKEMLVEHLEIEVSCNKEYDWYGDASVEITVDISFDGDNIHRTSDQFSIKEAN